MDGAPLVCAICGVAGSAHEFSTIGAVVAEELFSINMNIVIVVFPFRSADLLFTCGQRIRT